MNRRQLLLFSLGLLLLIPSGAKAQIWTGIIGTNRAVDWSAPGVNGGIPARTTICSTLSPGVTAAQINSAISSCPANEVVYLNSGTYSLSSEIVMKSNVTLRGAGANLTLITFSSGGTTCSIGGSEDVCISGTFNWNGGPNNITTWTAGYSKGTSVITLGSTSGLSVGQLLILDQADDTSDPGLTYPFVNGTSTSFSAEAGSPGRIVNGITYTQQEYKLVTAISGNQVTISPPLYMPNWRTSQGPSAWWANSLIQNAGIENLTLDHSNSSNLSGTVFFNAYNCWLKGIRSIYATNSNGGGRNHVWFQYSARITVRDSYFYGTRNTATLSYGVEPWQSADLLVENNIFQHIVSPLLVGATSGSVFGYNYSLDHYYAVDANWNMPGPSFTHDAGVAMNLFEGNQGTGMVEDNIHGTHNLDTYYRNHWIGRDPGKTEQTVPVELASYSRFMNIIGNVMGEAGYNTPYQVEEPNLTGCNTAIYLMGWDNVCSGGLPDALVAQTVMRWGNYDTVTNGVNFNASEVPSTIGTLANPVPSTQSLPTSLYLSSQPGAWWATPWGTPPWPPVGPDVTGGDISGWAGHANANPARLCYENTSQTNGILNFNATACYGQGPMPPTNINISIQ